MNENSNNGDQEEETHLISDNLSNGPIPENNYGTISDHQSHNSRSQRSDANRS